MRVPAVLLLLAVLVPARSGAAQEGEWTLTLDRPGMQPRISKGRLVLERDGKTWRGTLAFPMILYAKAHPLEKLKVSKRRLSFRIEDPKFTLEFNGKRDGGNWEGECDWKKLGRYPWRAEPAAAAGKQKRFDDGLPFGDGWERGEKTDLALDRLIAAADESGTDALLVIEDGKVVCERHFRGRRGPIHLMSVTKFLTAMAVALLVEEEKIESLDAPLSTWFPEWAEGDKAKVTLRHVLAHTSGIHRDRDARGRPNARKLNEQKDKVAYVRRNPLDEKPGKKFEYNNDAIALLSGVISAAAGKPADTYLEERLFQPLGIRDWTWDRDDAGHTVTYANLQMTARDLARIGMLVAQGGRWQDRELFPAKWIATLGDEPGSGLSEECGLVWWRMEKPKGYYHTGYLGQYLVVLPERKIVAVRLRAWDGSEDAAREFGGFLGLLRGALPK